MTEALRVGIAGAGIGGLALAALLKDSGHAPEIFERFEAPKPIGSGLVIQPVGQHVLDGIGCLDAALEQGNKLLRMVGHEVSSGQRVLDVNYDRHQTGQSFGLSIQRASIFQILYEAIQARGVPVHTDCHIVGRDQNRFIFEGGSCSSAFDLLVDASGARSRLSPLVSRDLPFGALWATLEWPDHCAIDKTMLSQKYNKARNMVGVMHTGKMPGWTQNSAAFFWSLPANGFDTWKSSGLQAWKDHALGLWPETAPFVDQITDYDQFTMALYSHGTLKNPIAPGIAFIGDAAHRASPQLGQGANMALLDAAALSQALSYHDVNKALPAYAQARRLHVAIYQAMSWAFTPLYQSKSRVLPFLRNRLLFPLSRVPPLPAILTSLVCGTLTEPVKSLNQTTRLARVSRSP